MDIEDDDIDSGTKIIRVWFDVRVDIDHADADMCFAESVMNGPWGCSILTYGTAEA